MKKVSFALQMIMFSKSYLSKYLMDDLTSNLHKGLTRVLVISNLVSRQNFLFFAKKLLSICVFEVFFYHSPDMKV